MSSLGDEGNERCLRAVAKTFESSIDIIIIESGHARVQKKEHFGFVDGISQPALE
jgi:deferrochelatase/peroxidase EfeB